MSIQHNNNAYSVRDIILRYESEEEEFVRELEQMMTNESVEESIQPDPEMDSPPILSVLCSLVDEIGSLRTENRRLKTRLAPVPRAKNVVQRMSAMFEQRGSSIFPRLRRSSGGNNHQSSDSVEVRNGARERLSTPPRKETNSMTTSTDVSYGREGVPPIVRPEMSDSDDIDEQIFNMEDEDHRSRDTTRRCDSVNMLRRQNDHSTSACTSPSSASSSRDPSEIMTTSRTSFLDLFGFRRRSTHIPQPTSAYAKTSATKQVIKKRRRKCSGNDSESSGMYVNIEEEQNHCSRLPNKPPRPASYYRRDDSEDSDCLRQSRQRKAASFLNVNNNYDHSHENIYRVDRETLLRHEKDTLSAEIEELKMRNQRLVEQLREKSQQQSKLQCHLHKAEMQVNTLSRRCALSEALDRLTMNERMEKSATAAMKKVEERLRVFENQMQNAKLEAANAHQMAINSNCNERVAHQNCLEKLENLQREHLRVIHSSLLEMGLDDANLKRRLENMPTYEALYAFTHSVVRRLNETRWSLIEKTSEASRAQMDLIATQSSLLVTHAQMERLRIGLSMRGKRQKRPSSFHGHDSFDRNVRQDLSFYLPFKLQGSRVENVRRAAIKRNSTNANDRNIEEEFLKLFSFSNPKVEIPERRREVHRIETMMREMNGNTRNIRRQTTITNASSNINMNPMRERNRGDHNNRRPISLVETEERRIRRNEETRRSIKFMKTNSIDHHKLEERQPSTTTSSNTRVTTVTSYQDIPSGTNSPHHTPVFSRRVIIPTKGNAYDHVAETPNVIPQMGRVRKLERAFSTESRNTTDSLVDRESEFRKRDYDEGGGGGERRGSSKIQRSQPVSRIKQPSTQLMRFRTMESSQQQQLPPSSAAHRPRTLEHTRIASPTLSGLHDPTRIPTPSSRTQHPSGEKRGWLERLKGIGKS